MILGGGHLKKDTVKRILKKNTVVDIVKKRTTKKILNKKTTDDSRKNMLVYRKYY